MSKRGGAVSQRITSFFEKDQSVKKFHSTDSTEEESDSEEEFNDTDTTSSLVTSEEISGVETAIQAKRDETGHTRDPVQGTRQALHLFKNGFGPFQPTNTSFPVDKNGRRFQVRWYGQFNWLEYSIELKRAFCFCCRAFGEFGQYDDAFVKLGFKNWKKALEKFRSHERSLVHKSSLLKWSEGQKMLISPEANIQAQLNHQHREEVQKNREYIKSVTETLIFLGRQCIAFRGHRENEDSQNKGNFRELLDLRSKDNPIIHNFYASREKYVTYTSASIQNELLEIVAGHIRDQILAEVRSAGVFGIIFNETQDISRHEQASLVLRFVSKDFAVHERFIGFHRAISTDGESLYELLLTLFGRFELDVQNVVAQCYDGASNMRGGYKGVAARIRATNGRAIYIHCNGHVLNLVLVDSVKEIAFARNTLGIVSELSKFIDASAKRHAVFERVQKDSSSKVMTLKSLSDTRWSCRAEALNSVKEQFEEIVKTLENIADDDPSSGAQAEMLLKSVSTFDFVFNLRLLSHIFSVTNILSKYLQSTCISICDALEKVRTVHQSMLDLRSEQEFDLFWKEAIDICTKLGFDDPVLPRKRKVTTRLGGGSTDPPYTDVKHYYIVSSFYPIIDIITSRIEERFNENDLSILRDMEKLLTLDKFSAISGDDSAITNVAAFYNLNAADLKAELRVFCNLIKDRVNTESNNKSHILQDRKMFFSEDPTLAVVLPVLSKVMKMFWTCPVSSCSAERSFSCLRRLKTYMRGTMGQDRLSALAFLNIERDTPIDLDKVVNYFASESSRKLKLL